jgi:hypothetical protein
MILDDEDKAALDRMIEQQRQVVNALSLQSPRFASERQSAGRVLQQLLLWQQTCVVI